MKAFLSDLAEYNHHSNEKLIESYSGRFPEKSQHLFSHILNAHHIWNSRILREESLVMPWDDIKSGKFSEVNKANLNKSLEIISNIDLDQVIAYSNTRGEKFENKVSDMLYHIFNHSTYHRAQIASDVVRNGLDAVSTDYIFYKRDLKLV